MFDPFFIAKAISRINVGYRAHHNVIVVPNTSLITRVLCILKANGLINSFFLNFSNKDITVVLNITSFHSKLFPQLTLISTPGNRQYYHLRNILAQQTGNPLIIISSKGGLTLLNDLNGGEVFCVLGLKLNSRKQSKCA